MSRLPLHVLMTDGNDQLASPLGGVRDPNAAPGDAAALSVLAVGAVPGGGFASLTVMPDDVVEPVAQTGLQLLNTWARGMVFSPGVGWIRAASVQCSTDGQPALDIEELPGSMARLQAYDPGTDTFSRLTASRTYDDEFIGATAIPSALDTMSRIALVQGGEFARARAISSLSVDPDTPIGVQQVAQTTEWSESDGPAAATQATCTRVNPGGGSRLVCRSITARVAAAGTAQTPLRVFLRDGATGAGTIIWQAVVACPVNSADGITLTPNIVGSPDTDMTLEFAGAGVADSLLSVALSGFTAL
jgi:hypothetical protein